MTSHRDAPCLSTPDIAPDIAPDTHTPRHISKPGTDIPMLRSSDLFGTAREIPLEHGEAIYRLRITHSNKLILTK